MELTATALAKLIEGTIEGDGTVLLNQVAKIEAGTPGCLTFLANPEYETFIYETGASAVLVETGFDARKPLPEGLTLIRVSNPYQAFANILKLAIEDRQYPVGIHPTAFVSPKASIGAECYIGPFALIEDGAIVGDGCQIHSHVSIGRKATLGINCILHRHVSIMDGCRIGNECTFQSGATIGSDGFGFAPNQENTYQKVPQTGNVVLEDQCEVGAGTTIDRATLGSTFIESGVKLDNQIQVAHNVRIGRNTVIAAQTGIAGSTTIGANCMIGGQVGFAGHIQVADGVKIAAQSGVTKSIQEENSVWQGTPALPIRDYQMQQITLRKLIRSLALQRIDALEQKLS